MTANNSLQNVGYLYIQNIGQLVSVRVDRNCNLSHSCGKRNCNNDHDDNNRNFEHVLQLSELHPQSILNIHLLMLSPKLIISISKNPVSSVNVLLNQLIYNLHRLFGVLRINKHKEVTGDFILHKEIGTTHMEGVRTIVVTEHTMLTFNGHNNIQRMHIHFKLTLFG